MEHTPLLQLMASGKKLVLLCVLPEFAVAMKMVALLQWINVVLSVRPVSPLILTISGWLVKLTRNPRLLTAILPNL